MERKERDGGTLSGTVTTEGGTPVAYWRSGKGPPIVLVHACGRRPRPLEAGFSGS